MKKRELYKIEREQIQEKEKGARNEDEKGRSKKEIEQIQKKQQWMSE